MARFSITALAVVVAALLIASSAGAADPLSITSTVPANGAFRPPTPSGGIPFQVVVSGVPADAQVAVTVATNPATGPDGTLPSTYRVDFFFLAPNGVPGGFSALSDPGPNAWSADVGTYYWQLTATWTDAAGVLHAAAGKVEKLSIGTPPAGTPAPAGGGSGRTTLAMSALDASYYVRQVIRRHTTRRAVRLHVNCARRTSRSFRCRPTWRDSRSQWSAVATVVHTRRAGRIVASTTVTGRRATRQCLRTGTLKSCRKPFRWRSTIAARPLGTR
jgi:hypothetical protein